MQLVRLNTLPHPERCKIEARQKQGRMGKYVDRDGYCCYCVEEYDAYKPRKYGRPINN